MIKDGVSSFNFSSAATTIKALLPVGNYTVTFIEIKPMPYRSNLITDITNYRNIGYQIHNKFGDELIVMLIMPVMVWDLTYHLLLKNCRLQILLLFLDNATTIKMEFILLIPLRFNRR
jgi:hypothetical protein